MVSNIKIEEDKNNIFKLKDILAIEYILEQRNPGFEKKANFYKLKAKN